MQNFKMLCKKRFQFTFWSEILSKSKYLMITKSLLNWMNWIPRSEISILNGIDLILHITALRHADEDVVLAQNATKSQNEGGLGQLSLQYKYRYSRVSGLNDLGLIPLCLWKVWTLFSHQYWQQNWILGFKFNFFYKQNGHFCNALIQKQQPNPNPTLRRAEFTSRCQTCEDIRDKVGPNCLRYAAKEGKVDHCITFSTP